MNALAFGWIIRDWRKWENGKRPYPEEFGGIRPLNLYIKAAHSIIWLAAAHELGHHVARAMLLQIRVRLLGAAPLCRKWLL